MIASTTVIKAPGNLGKRRKYTSRTNDHIPIKKVGQCVLCGMAISKSQ